jgi:WD40 repeat protein
MLPRAQDPNSYFQSDDNIRAVKEKQELAQNLLKKGQPIKTSSKVLNLLLHENKLLVSESGFILNDLNSGISYKGHKGPVTCCVVLRDLVYTGSWDKSIRVWDLEGNLVKIIQAHNDFVKDLAKDEDVIYSCSSDKLIKKFKDFKEILVFKGHTRAVESIDIKDSCLYSGSSDSTIKIWDKNTGEILKSIKAHETSIYHVLVVETGIYSASADKEVKRWDEDSVQVYKHKDFVNCVLVISNYLLSGSRDGLITLWDINSSKALKKLQAHADGVTCLCLKEGVEFYSGSIDGTIRSWDIRLMLEDVYDSPPQEEKDEIQLTAEEEAELMDL